MVRGLGYYGPEIPEWAFGNADEECLRSLICVDLVVERRGGRSTRGSGLGMISLGFVQRLLHVLSGQEHWNVFLRDPYIVHSSYHGISFGYDCICCKRG